MRLCVTCEKSSHCISALAHFSTAVNSLELTIGFDANCFKPFPTHLPPEVCRRILNKLAIVDHASVWQLGGS